MITEAKNLLNSTAQIIKHQKDIEKLKGESFNIFTILKMDKRETITHTPFIAELLNPNGTHLMGDIFLKLFLSIDKIKSVEKAASLNLDKIHVCENKHIGEVVLDDGNESGGYLDICLVDNNNRCITIENKIDHKTEQPKQVLRYFNYNRANNVVFYLTPFGTEPSIGSKCKLTVDIDFYLLSYKIDIINWLRECLKETGDSAILRQSIRQYIILLQKITFSMENEQAKELNSLMLNNFEEAAYISSNFLKAKREISENVRQQVVIQLREKLGDIFNVYPGLDTNYKDSQIWLKYKNHISDDCKLFFGIQSFSPEATEEMFVGIFSLGGKHTEYRKNKFSGEPFWPDYYTLENGVDDQGLKFSEGEILKKLNQDKEFKNSYIQRIFSESEKFISEHKNSLLKFLDAEKNA